MGWRCPECGKTFRNTNQWHSCYRLDQSAHLINKPEHIIEAYKKLHEAIVGFGDVEINSVKTAIQIRAGATFLTIKLKSDHIILEFQLNHAINDFPVHK